MGESYVNVTIGKAYLSSRTVLKNLRVGKSASRSIISMTKCSQYVMDSSDLAESKTLKNLSIRFRRNDRSF